MSIPMTKSGFLKLQGELDDLRAKLPDIQKAIGEAREKGDLKENAEYHAARESMGMLEAKIAELDGRLGQAQIMDESKVNKDQVQFGAIVKILDMEYDDEEEFSLVGDGEADPVNNKILTTSPMGQSMLNKKVGDLFIVDAPSGKLEYKILEITY
jgi:transcription elongation factor GreA